MSKETLVHRTLSKEFSDTFANWFDKALDRANNRNDIAGVKALVHAKDLYYLDYMAGLIDELATKAEAMVQES